MSFVIAYSRTKSIDYCKRAFNFTIVVPIQLTTPWYRVLLQQLVLPELLTNWPHFVDLETLSPFFTCVYLSAL
jgi:hypothetical protein